jgi:hypothetical protein
MLGVEYERSGFRFYTSVILAIVGVEILGREPYI